VRAAGACSDGQYVSRRIWLVSRVVFDKREAVGFEELECGERAGVLFDGELNR
jgi:hypothetical protein